MKSSSKSNIEKSIFNNILTVCLLSNIAIGLIGIISIVIIAKGLLLSNQTAKIVFIASILLIAALTAASALLFIRLSRKNSKSIIDSIDKAADAANHLANGDIAEDIIINSDEVTYLAEPLKRISLSLKTLKSEINMMVNEAKQGKLNARIQLNAYSGCYSEFAAGINDIFEAVAVPLDALSHYTNKLADGDFEDKTENTYKGQYVCIFENLNKLSASICSLINQTETLAIAAKKGDLDVRGNESGLGAYSKVIDNFNNTLDSVKQSLAAVTEYSANIAEGNIEFYIENNYEGYYASCIDNLNKVRSSLALMTSQTDILSQAVEAGDLSTRGGVSELKGCYLKAVDGFNKALDYAATSIDEAIQFTRKLSVNDYTAKMSVEYNGVFKELASSLNSVLMRFKGLEWFITDIGNGIANEAKIKELENFGKRCENDNLTHLMLIVSKSIRALIDTSNSLASSAIEGDLSRRGDIKKFKGGYVEIVEGINKTLDAFTKPIEEASSVLQEFSKGDLTVLINGDYKGEYHKIKSSLNSAIEKLNSLMCDINISSNQVALGSKQVAAGSQSLSNGTAEQALAVEKLTSTVTQFAYQTKKNAQDASKANALASNAQKEALLGNEKMKQMLDSMHSISNSSASISKIIKVIDDIAFQTNILALNAAVEAARAGQYGKGFAVVAEEVRNLAAKSAEAAKNTTALIDGSINKVQAGMKTADETAEVLNQISKSVYEAVDLIENIAKVSDTQTNAIEDIDKGLLQVSVVVQANATTAEESAASSQELSSHANTLIDMVGKFKLK